MGCRDRLEAREPGGQEPVEAASRRSRARAARALTGLRTLGHRSPQAIIARRSRRGAEIHDSADACTKLQAAGQKFTSLQRVDRTPFFRSPTGAHLAPFILPSLGRWSASRQSCAPLRQLAIKQEPDEAHQQQSCVQSHCGRYADGRTALRSPNRPREGDGQMGLGRTWRIPVSWRADEKDSSPTDASIL
jgi:hypothetical protein